MSNAIYKWDWHFLDLALLHARMSKDPSTQVGAIIVDSSRDIIAHCFNGFPRQIQDTEERLNHRQTKYDLILHAEMNAIISAARRGISVNRATMYIVATNHNGETWGGPPCTRCAVGLIQAGIKEIVSYSPNQIPIRWLDDLHNSALLLREALVKYREVPLRSNSTKIE